MEIARSYLLGMLSRDDLRGLDFLDICCSSGMHSFAALLGGSQKIHSFAPDPDSVRAADMLSMRAGERAHWMIERGDMLDDAYIASLGTWNVVYSWGALTTPATSAELSPMRNGRWCTGVLYIAPYSADVETDPKYWLRTKPDYQCDTIEATAIGVVVPLDTHYVRTHDR